MTHASVEIAPLTQALLPELVDLWVAAWTQAMPQIDFEARRPWLTAHLEGLHQQAYVTRCALEAKGALVGAVGRRLDMSAVCLRLVRTVDDEGFG